MRVPAFIVAAVIVVLSLHDDALAFGLRGHIAICEIAYRELQEPVRKEVDRLMDLDDRFLSFTQSCNWADHPRKRHFDHFVNVRRTATGISQADPCPLAARCIMTAIEKDLAILKNPSSSDFSKLRALKFLSHWIADLHQPLHVSFSDDREGYNIRVSGLCDKSLHHVWDDCLFDRGLGPDAVKIAATLHSAVTRRDRKAWTASGPVDWANESLAIATRPSLGYCVKVGGACQYSAAKVDLGPNDRPKTVVIDAAYVDDHGPILAGRIKRAGIRLGQVLNAALGG